MKKLWLALFALAAWPLMAGAAGPHWKPEITGPWRTLFRPTIAGNFINDHCVFKDPKGDWHLVGITSLKHPMIGNTEFWFAHGVTPALLSPMRELPALFKGWPDKKLKWAPHAVWDGSTLHLFAGPGPIRHFTSQYGSDFKYVDIAVKNNYPFLRDTMVFRLASGEWIMYATDLVKGVDSVSAWRSKDLYQWSPAGVVFSAVRPAPVFAPVPSSSCESPFVVQRDDGYYLFMTLTVTDDKTYMRSPVFFSTDPLNFGRYAAGGKGETAKLVTILETHAPELIQDGEQWYITNAGWPGHPRPAGCPDGQACIAELTWKPMIP